MAVKQTLVAFTTAIFALAGISSRASGGELHQAAPDTETYGAPVARDVRNLGHEEWRVRVQATRALRKAGASALPAIRGALKSDDAEVRMRARQLIDAITNDLVLAGMGHTLIADTYGNRIVEVDRNGQEVWTLAGLKQPVVAQPLGRDRVLVAEREGGRVSVVDRKTKKAVWVLEGLERVWFAHRLANGNTLITSCGEELFSPGKVIEVDRDKKVVWEMGDLQAPRSCHRLEGGNTLIVERKLNRVIEVDKDKKIVWKVEKLNAPLHAVRLKNGHTLICEWSPARVVEVDANGKRVWAFSKGLEGTGDAVRLAHGHTLITDFSTSRVLQVDRSGDVVWEYRRLNMPCAAIRLPLNSPKDPAVARPSEKDE